MQSSVSLFNLNLRLKHSYGKQKRNYRPNLTKCLPNLDRCQHKSTINWDTFRSSQCLFFMSINFLKYLKKHHNALEKGCMAMFSLLNILHQYDQNQYTIQIGKT